MINGPVSDIKRTFPVKQSAAVIEICDQCKV